MTAVVNWEPLVCVGTPATYTRDVETLIYSRPPDVAIPAGCADRDPHFEQLVQVWADPENGRVIYLRGAAEFAVQYLD